MSIARSIELEAYRNEKAMQIAMNHEEKRMSWRDGEYMKIVFSDDSYIAIKRFNERGAV